MWHDGDRNRWDHDELIHKDQDSPNFDENDIVTMTLNLDSRTLCYQMNDGKIYESFDNIATGEGYEYCLAVSIWAEDDCIELLSYRLSQI